MAKLDDTGVYQLKGGNWTYRYTITENGRKKDVRKSKDDNGNSFHTKREAIKARQIAIGREQEGNKPKSKDRRTIAEVYGEYCESGRDSKAYTTIRKQVSLWKNHLCTRFGKRFVDDITSADVNDYLAELYYKKKLSFRYVCICQAKVDTVKNHSIRNPVRSYTELGFYSPEQLQAACC